MQNSREFELLNQIKDLQNQLKILKKQKKYGLVWEEKEETIDKNNLPIFKEITDLRIHQDENKPVNLIIEWDNFHTLSALQYTHFGKIDVIYIDPPYNTKNKDFVYNDNYVDKEDTFRHSKWLSFMKKRLKLARNLLKDDGVIFISIDDNEFAQLKLLCDEVFGEGNFIVNFTWQKNFAPKNDNKFISTSQEYILLYWKSKENFNRNLLKRTDKQNEWYKNPDNDERWVWTSWSCIATSFSEKYVFWVKWRNWNIHFPPKWRCWRFSEEKFEELKTDNRLWFWLDGNWVPRIKRFLSEMSDWIVPQSLLKYEEVWSWQDWALDLKNIFSENVFTFPKPKKLIKFFIDRHINKSSIILDFFAWSGTTGHAVLELNKEDGWNRQFILCSNRENTKENPEKNICRDITYERNKRVITGYTNAKWEKIEWLGWNLRYYKTEFITKNPEKSLDDLRYSFMQKCDDLLCIKEDIFTKIEKNDLPETIKIFKRKNNFLLVCYDISHFEKLSKILKIFDKTEKVSVYIFTLKNDIIAEFDNLGTNISIKNIPNEILETYKKIFFK